MDAKKFVKANSKIELCIILIIALFIVGKGTNDSVRKNAFYIDKDGKGIFTSDVKINGDLSLNDTIYTLNQKSHQVFIQSSQPSGGEVGDIWCKPI